MVPCLEKPDQGRRKRDSKHDHDTDAIGRCVTRNDEAQVFCEQSERASGNHPMRPDRGPEDSLGSHGSHSNSVYSILRCSNIREIEVVVAQNPSLTVRVQRTRAAQRADLGPLE